MIQKTERKISKRHLTVIITALVLVLLIVAYVVIDAVVNASSNNQSGGASNPPPTVNTEIGESVYLNNAVAYPYIAKDSIKSISVSSDVDSFYMHRDVDDEGNLLDYFLFFYEPTVGNKEPYLPDIVFTENNFDYTSLYAVEGSDGLNVYKVDYLCAAIGAMFFDEAIPVPVGETDEKKEERRQTLNRYGLNVEDRETIIVTYIDGDGNEKTHRIYIGDKLITGKGYYYMLEGRDVVYTSASSERLSYALSGFESFLHSRIVAEGLPTDKGMSPYLTSDYKHWVTDYCSTEGALVKAGSTVIALGDYKYPVYKSTSESQGRNGYREGFGVKTLISLDLESLSNYPEFTRLISLMEGQKVGQLSEPISVTVVSNLNEATLSSGTNNKYSYSITRIESVFTDDTEIFTEGTPVGDNNLIKVEYRYYIDEVLQSTENCHAVIDLSEESVITDEVKAKLRAASVGQLSEAIVLDGVYYTEENATLRKIENVITEIIAIYDQDGMNQPSVSENSIVTYCYYNLMDGVKMGEPDYVTLDLSTATEGFYLNLKNTLLGLGTGSVNLTIEENVFCQPFKDFKIYTFEQIRGFTTKELVVSFKYLGQSEVDPFYTEAGYVNTLPATHKYGGYPINTEACDKVVRLLGGISAGGTSGSAEGLVGTETVAVGLTPENMIKYGLYDGYTIYFELPRGITTVTYEGSNAVDYRWHDTIGFTLYVSETEPDGTRYIGSDMYNIVVKIGASDFNYLEESFGEMWARKNLVMMDYKDIDNFSASFNMTDLVGKYNFKLDHSIIYIGSDGKHYTTKPEGIASSEYNELKVTTSIDGFVEGESSVPGVYDETELSKILASEGRTSFILANLYNRVAGIPSGGFGLTEGSDTLGTASFKDLLIIMYSTYYTGTLSAEDQAYHLENSPVLLTLTFDVYASSAYSYVYDFYRVSDREVMVSTYRLDDAGNKINPISDFTITTFAFKKIVRNITNLLNGERLDPDVGYED